MLVRLGKIVWFFFWVMWVFGKIIRFIVVIIEN